MSEGGLEPSKKKLKTSVQSRDTENNTNDLIGDRDAHKTCYVLKPRQTPRKRSRYTPFVSLHPSIPEQVSHTFYRWNLYVDLMKKTYTKINNILRASDESTIKSIVQFVTKSPKYDEETYPLLPSLILTGVKVANQARLYSNLTSHIANNKHLGIAVSSITSINTAQLKYALKTIISDIIGKSSTNDEEDELTRPLVSDLDVNTQEVIDRRLNYDLDILAEYCRTNPELKHILVIIQDVDAYSGSLLYNLIRVLKVYRSRIPFSIVMGISTTLTIFNAKVPRLAIRLMDCKVCDAVKTEASLLRLIEDIFLTRDIKLMLGPVMLRNIFRRYNLHTKSIYTLTSGIQYALMTHFFANPLSITMDTDTTMLTRNFTDNHATAMRTLQSFRDYITLKMDQKVENKDEIRKLITDSKALLKLFLYSRESFHSYLNGLTDVLKLLATLLSLYQEGSTSYQYKRSQMDLLIDALSGKLIESSLLKELEMFLNRMNVETVEKLLSLLNDNFSSNSDITAMKARWKVEERIGKSSHRELNADISVSLSNYIRSSIKPYTDFVFHEILVFEGSPIYESVFSPKYRATIERGLSDPNYYLDQLPQLDSAEDGNDLDILPISLAYRLYKESGPLINVYDYWSAFHQVLTTGELHNMVDISDLKEAETAHNEDNTSKQQCSEVNEEQKACESEIEDGIFTKQETLAWTLNSIAELKHLGLVRESTGKRNARGTNGSVFLLQKLTWEGL
ncbi:origin recognition complex subunit 3 N-terminus-domain-containing protein [Dipodascopsis uninucleata]